MHTGAEILSSAKIEGSGCRGVRIRSFKTVIFVSGKVRNHVVVQWQLRGNIVVLLSFSQEGRAVKA